MIALHGFLGLPSDFDFLPEARYVNIADFPIDSKESFARRLNTSVKEKSILVGYSMGGRLALHALKDDPSKWEAAIIISANPGIECAIERRKRYVKDLEWAEKFQNEPWEPLLKEWNAQSVFCSHTLQRKEQDFDRTKLKLMLKNFSLGLQVPISVSQFSMPILWIVGSKDHPPKNLTFSNPHSKLSVVQESGHRVIWEQQSLVKKQIQEFINHVRR